MAFCCFLETVLLSTGLGSGRLEDQQLTSTGVIQCQLKIWGTCVNDKKRRLSECFAPDTGLGLSLN